MLLLLLLFLLLLQATIIVQSFRGTDGKAAALVAEIVATFTSSFATSQSEVKSA